MEIAGTEAQDEDEDPAAKRQRILEETRDIDADSDGQDEDSTSDERCAPSSRYATWPQ